jgi:very-short-patch-repair endonuclease
VRRALLTPFADRQHGLVTWQQAASIGTTRWSWQRAQAAGDLVPVFRGACRFPEYPSTDEQTILAGVLCCGSSAIASHRSAAYLWGVEVRGVEPVEVIVPERGRSPDRAGLVVHRPIDLIDLRPTRRAGIPTTNPLRILVDLGASAPDRVSDALEHFVIRGLVSRRAAEATLARHRRQGRHGVGSLAAALDAWALGDKPPDSTLEPAMGRLVRRYHLPEYEFQLPVGRYIADFAWLAYMVIAEVDGWEKYVTRADFEAQMRRDAELQAYGWMVLHFTWLQVVRRPELVAARLRTAFAARS